MLLLADFWAAEWSSQSPSVILYIPGRLEPQKCILRWVPNDLQREKRLLDKVLEEDEDTELVVPN